MGVAGAVTQLVAAELLIMIARGFTAGWELAVIAVVGVKAVVHVAVEVLTPVMPGAGTDEDAAIKPLWAVVTIGRTVVGSVIVVTVGAARFRAEVNAYADLGVGLGRSGGKAERGDSSE